MTDITLQSRHKVPVRFTGGGVAIVTGFAITSDTGVIPGTANKGSGSVTVGAIETGVDMVSMFAGCSHTVVARGAIIYDTTVIKCGRDKTAGVMTDTTILVRCYMILRFTSRE